MLTKKQIAESTTIFRAVVGSQSFGLSVSDTPDRDEMGVCVEPYEHFFGLRERFEQYTYRDAKEGQRSGPNDLDLTIYGLAKFARLALGGNPSILTLLFTNKRDILVDTELGQALRRLAPSFVGNNIFGPYLGYMRQQRYRMRNRVKMPSRPELVRQFGYDTKYAGHIIRLGYQGIELATTGYIELPMKEPYRSHILDIRRGRVTEQEVLKEAASLEDKLVALRDGGTVPPADSAKVEEFVISAYHEMHPEIGKRGLHFGGQ